MTPFKPYLIVSRLVVVKGGAPVYDEHFHPGVNIIRGRNSSGKSTIADFLFYSLGGELTKWKAEAKSCDYTFVEVSLSGRVFVLKREVDERSRRGMDIFQGSYEESMQTSVSGWLRYPYQATENKESFYQALLKEIGIPFSKSEDNNSITLHQLLRLMYVDQMTSLDRLFKFDRFDSPNKRKAIGELMIGLSDYELYEARVKAQKVSALLDGKIKEIGVVHRFIGDEIKTLEVLDEEIAEKNSTVAGLYERLSDEGKENPSAEEGSLTSMRAVVGELRSALRLLEQERAACAFDLADSRRFIASLISRIKAIEESKSVINALADIGFHYCPACFTEVEPRNSGCVLCGSDASEGNGEDPTFRVRKEIEFQISESNQLIVMRQEKLDRLDVELSQLRTNLASRLRDLEAAERPLVSVGSEKRAILLEIGAKTREIDQLNEAKTRYAKLASLYEMRDHLQRELNTFTDYIHKKEASVQAELSKKRRVLSALTKRVLEADRDHEDVFTQGKSVEFDFGEDRVSIDDRVLFSASSMVFLKNAFRLALLEASCSDASYLYPRFLLMDNVEDKGMEPERSHVFQRQIVRVSSDIAVPHQIIFTTSMIAPELEGSEYCVGGPYDERNKTLRFASVS